jgi:uncharacterized membrane protein (DUF4010 family)
MDALTVAMSARTSGIEPLVAARAIGVGVLANTVFKLALAAGIGRGTFRSRVSVALLLMAVVTAAAIAIV